jgi:hypothetical protein
MRAVELRVERKAFGELLGEMREWIDRVRPGPVKFASEGDPNGQVLVRLGLSQDDLWLCVPGAWQAKPVKTG